MELGGLNKVVLLVKDGCPYCDKSKGIVADLVARNVITPDEYTLVDVGEGSPESKKVFQDAFATVPQVFINGQHRLGGSETLERMYQSGELDNIL